MSGQNGRSASAVGQTWFDDGCRVELDPCVARDRQPGPASQDEHAPGLHRRRHRADEPEPSVHALAVAVGVAVTGRLVRVLRVRGAVVALDDDLDECVRGLVRLGLEQRIEIGGRIRIPAGLRQRDGGDEQDGENRQQASPALAPEGVGARITAPIPRPPEGARTSPVWSAAAMLDIPLPLARRSSANRSCPQ